MSFVVHHPRAGLPYKVHNPDPVPDKTITGLGLNYGCYFHLEPKVIRESDKNHLHTHIGPLHLFHKLQGPDIKNYQNLKPGFLEEE